MDPMLDNRSLKSFAATAALGASIVIGIARRAEAQVGTAPATQPATQPFVAGDFFVAINGPDGARLGLTDVSRFFNLARCNCQTPVGIYVALLASGIAKRGSASNDSGTVSFVLGPGCNTTFPIAQAGCFPLGSQPVQSFLDQAQTTFPTDARTLSNPIGVAIPDGGVIGTCAPPNGAQFTQTINVNFDFNGDGRIDLSIPEKLIIDLAPPPAPQLTTAPGEEALDLTWPPLDTSITSDLLGYQILCSRADQYQVFKETATADGLSATGTFTAAFSSCPPARTGEGVEGLDPLFVCSSLLGPDVNLNTTTNTLSTRIEVLQNGITYAAAVLAIDQSGNATSSNIDIGPPPAKTASFYDTYRSGDPPGGATGGLCAVGPARPRLTETLGGLALVAAGAAGVLARRRNRRRR